MRLPNGYGSVVKLSGNRRKPFMVRKTKGFNAKGHPIYTIIGYSETREEGLQLLADYNKNPYDVDASKITLEDLFEKFKNSTKFIKFSKSTKNSILVAFNKTDKLNKLPYRQLRAYHMQAIVDESGAYATQAATKNFWKHMDKYALELDIIETRYSELLTSDKVQPIKEKKIFTEDEINLLWENVSLPWVPDILIMLYTGFRISEYMNLKVEDINLEELTFMGGTKTEAGKNRIVPIHSRILPLVKEKMINNPTTHLTYGASHKKPFKDQGGFKRYFDSTISDLGMEHIPHETRHTFRSRLDNKNANKVSIDLLMGHSSKGIGERVYTHKTIKQLRDTIELLD